jgi:hypothetical protein
MLRLEICFCSSIGGEIWWTNKTAMALTPLAEVLDAPMFDYVVETWLFSIPVA